MDSTEGSSGMILQRARVIALRFAVTAHLVHHGALHREDAPVGLVGRMRALQHVERLLEVAGIGQRAAVGAEQHLVRRDYAARRFRARRPPGCAGRSRAAPARSAPHCRDRADWRGISRPALRCRGASRPRCGSPGKSSRSSRSSRWSCSRRARSAVNATAARKRTREATRTVMMLLRRRHPRPPAAPSNRSLTLRLG